MSELLRPLIEAARRGDREALNTLARCVDRFVHVFSGQLSRRVRQAWGSTVDFVLEGLAEALSRLEEFEYRGDEQFYAWVACFIRNRIADAGRRQAAAKRAATPLPLQEEGEDVQWGGPSPSQLLFREEVRSAVAQALLELQLEHPQEMDAVLLKVFEGYSWSALKDALGLASEKPARTLFARGVDLLRPLVKRRLGEEVYMEYLRR